MSEQMDDTISRQAAIDTLERKKDKKAKGDMGGFYNKIIQNDIDALMQLPPAEPEIIRCGECKNHGRAIAWCAYSPDNAFCSYAERRTDATD